MTARQFFAIQRARWRIVLGFLVFAVAAAVAIALLLPRQYTATASVVIDVKSPDPVAGMLSPALALPSYMATQVDIMESDRVAVRVVRALRLTESADMRRQWREATGEAGDFEVWIGHKLQVNLDCKPSRESNILQVHFTSVDPRFSAGVANAFVKAYLDTQAELRMDPARQYSSFFDARAKQLLADVESAQSRLSAFQREHDLLGSDERFDVEMNRLNELSSQLVILQTAQADSQGRHAAARANADELQDVISNPVVSGLRIELARQDARAKELGTRFGDAYPQLQELRASIAELNTKIATETARLSGSVGVSNGINQARAGQIRQAVEEQRAKVLKLRDRRDEMAVLQREVDHSQKAYDAVMLRLNQTQLESQNTQTNASVLMPATEPSRPSSPRRMLIALVGLAVGLFGGIALALLRETTDPRVRSLDDISRTIGLPVLGRMLGAEKRNWLGRRVRHPLPARALGHLPGLAAK